MEHSLSRSALEATPTDIVTPGGRPLELAVIVPTFKESRNIRPLLEQLENVLRGVVYEVIFVDDDSPDGTADIIRGIAIQDNRVRLIHRIGRRGLASACLEGMLGTSAPYLAVMDADLQHDETVLPQMLARARTGQYDLVVGSRNMTGGSMGELSRERVALSRLGLKISQLVSRHKLSDPMSGYFLLTRQFFREVMHSTSGVGFKILLDLVASARRPVRYTEVPYHFRPRKFGESKLDINVGIEYLYLIADKLIDWWLPPRFVLYCMAGLLGLCFHLSVLGLFHSHWNYSYQTALVIAISFTLGLNYALIKIFTYRDRSRRVFGFLSGLLIYAVVCAAGNLSNYALSKWLFDREIWWPIAGISGAAVGCVWNFAGSSILMWRTLGNSRLFSRTPSSG